MAHQSRSLAEIYHFHDFEKRGLRRKKNKIRWAHPAVVCNEWYISFLKKPNKFRPFSRLYAVLYWSDSTNSPKCQNILVTKSVKKRGKKSHSQCVVGESFLLFQNNIYGYTDNQ